MRALGKKNHEMRERFGVARVSAGASNAAATLLRVYAHTHAHTCVRTKPSRNSAEQTELAHAQTTHG